LEGSADADVEVLASVRRGTVAFKAPRILKVSAPWLQAGVLWDDHERAFGKDDADLLVLHGTSAYLNPAIEPSRLAQAQRRDPERYAREYLAEFASDSASAFLPGQAISDAVARGRLELPAVSGVHYIGAVDVSGGAARENADAFAFSVCHAEGKGSETRVVQDVVRSWRASRTVSLNLEHAVQEISALCHTYHVSTLWGDRYASHWVVEAFKRTRIEYRNPDASKLDRSGIYREAGPFFTQGRATILDHEATIRELRSLQRKLKAGGREVVDHPQSGHDDHANALCLAMVKAGVARGEVVSVPPIIGRKSRAETAFGRDVTRRLPNPFSEFRRGATVVPYFPRRKP
jgi:hypothetical protein